MPEKESKKQEGKKKSSAGTAKEQKKASKDSAQKSAKKKPTATGQVKKSKEVMKLLNQEKFQLTNQFSSALQKLATFDTREKVSLCARCY